MRLSSWKQLFAKCFRLCGRKRPQRGSKRLYAPIAHYQLLEDRALLATFVWDGGGTDNNFGTATNWANDVAPANGDDLVFVASTNRFAPNNNSLTSINSITFYGGGYNITGNAFTLSGGSIAAYNSAGVNRIGTSTMTLGANTTINSVFMGTTLQVDCAITLNSKTLTFDAEGSISQGGVISGTSTIHKNGGGTLTMSGGNTYTGVTNVNSGVLAIGNNAGLGSSTAGNNTVVMAGAQVQMGNNTSTEPFTISGHGIYEGHETLTTSTALAFRSSGALLGTAATANFNGAITLAADATIAASGGATNFGSTIALGAFTLTANGNAQTLSLNGVISGSGHVRIGDNYNAGTVALQAINTYTGTTTITSGTLSLTGANGAIQGSGGTLGAIAVYPGATLALTNTTNNNTDRILNSGDITLEGGTFTFLGNGTASSTETVDVISLARGHSTINSSPGTASLSNVLTASSLTRSANATVHFTSSNVTLGTTGAIENRIVITNAPTEIGSGKSSFSSEGILPYAMVNNADFANYDGTGATIRAFPSGAYYDTFSGGAANTGVIKITIASDSATTSKTFAGIFFAPGANQTLTLNTGVTLTVGAIAKSNAGFSTVITGGTAFDLAGTAVSSGEGISIVAGNTITYTSPFGTTNRLVLSGAGTHSVNGVKSYTGGTIINSGTVSIASGSTLGAASSTVTWVSGTLTAAAANTTLARNIILDNSNVTHGSGNLIYGASAAADTITVTGRNVFNMSAAATINSQITGTGAFIKVSAQALTLTDINNNPGGFVLENNTVNLNPTSTAGLPLGGASTQLTLVNTPTLVTNVAAGLTISNPVDIRAHGTTISFTGTNTITFAGAVDFGGLSNISVSRQSSTTNLLVFSGTMTGTGGFDLTGTGEAILNPTSSTMSGPVRASLGTAVINSSLSNSDFSVANDSTGTPTGGSGMPRIMGTGTVGSLAASNDGTILPGSAATIGKLTVNGHLNLSEGGLLLTRATGYTAAGTDYSQVVVMGASVAALGGQSQLIVETSGITTSGTFSDVISASAIRRDTSLLPIAVINTSKNVAQSSEVTATGLDINVALMDSTQTVPTLTATKIWDGGGADNNFTTAANWVGDVAPVANDHLVFPNGAIRQTANNNLTANTDFASITFYGDSYTLSGNAMDIVAGGHVSMFNHDGANTVSAPLAFLGSSSINSTFIGTTLTLSGAVTFSTTSTLTVNGSGATTISGAITDGAATATIVKNDPGTLSLNGANAYDGVTTVNAGIVSVGNGGGLGSTSGNTVVVAGAQVQVGNVTTTEAFTISGHGIFEGRETTSTTAALALRGSGALVSSASTANFGGTITLAANATIGSVGGTATFSGGISAATFELTINGNGQTTNITGGIGGNGNVLINNNFNGGTVSVQTVVAHTGPTTVTSGSLVLTGALGSLTSTATITVQPGATLSLTNTTNNNTNRIPDTADIVLNGGTLAFLGLNAGASTETVDVITLGKGHSTITSTVGTGTASNVFTASQLVRNATATVNFTGATLGTTAVSTQNRIVFTAAPTEIGAGAVTTTEGILPYALVNSADFANYDGTGLTIRALPATEYYSAIPASPVGTEIVKLALASESITTSANIAALLLSPSATQTVLVSSGVTLGVGVLARTSAAVATTISVVSGTATVDMQGTAVTPGEGLVIVGGNTLTISPDFTADDQLILGGAGTISFNGTKSYTGGTYINSGTVNLATSTSTLGTAAGSVTWVAGALNATAALTLGNNFSLGNSNVSIGANLTFGASAGTTTFTVTGRNRIDVTGATTINSQVTGTGIFIKTGGQALTLTDNNNDPVGFVLENNTINLNPTSASGLPLGGASTQLTLENAATLTTNVVAGMTLPNPIDIRSNGTAVGFAGSNPFTISNSITILGNSGISVTNTSTTGVIIPVDITGTGGIDKSGQGRLVLTTVAKTFDGAVRVQAGSLYLDVTLNTDVSLVNNGNANALYSTYLSSGSTATIQALATSANTVVAIGDNYNPGATTLVATEGIGILNASLVNLTEGGRVNFNATAYTTAGTTYDRLNVSGDVIVGGMGSVSVKTTGISTLGTFDDLIAAARTLGDPHALPVDAVDSTNTTDFLVQTTYGSVDVTLIPVSTSGVAIWDGSSDANWATAANWSGNDLPVNGQSLVFPDGASNLSNSNDYIPLTSIDSIVFLDDGYSLAQSGGSTLSIADGVLDVSSSATANTINLPLAITASQSFRTTRTAGDTLNFGGVISGSTGTVTIAAPSGTVNLTADNTYSGALALTNGTLYLEGSNSASSLTTSSGTTLGGSGGISGSLTIGSGAFLTPGTSPGNFSSGSITFASGSTITLELNGTAAGTQYDRLSVVGTVDLGSATLASSIGYSPSNGDVFIVIDNDGSDAVVGTFIGLPQGSPVSLGGKNFVINYAGGTGNDVVLTIDTLAPSAVSFVRSVPTDTHTPADTLVFRATFSEAVLNVVTTSFTVSGTTGTVTSISAVSASIYDLTVSGGNLANYNGTVGLNFSGSQAITDNAGNALPNTEPATDETYILDNLAPVLVVNIVKSSLSDLSNTSAVTFTFTESVTGFDFSDIVVTGGTLTGFTGSGASYSATFTAQDGVITSGSISIAAGVAMDIVGFTSNAASDVVVIDTTMLTFFYSAGTLTVLSTDNYTEEVVIAASGTASDVIVGGKLIGRITGATATAMTNIDFITTDKTDSVTVTGTTAAVTIDIGTAKAFSANKTGSITVNADGPLSVGASTMSGALTINAAGDVRDTGKLVIAGAVSVNAPGFDVVLDTTGNTYGSLAITADDVEVVEGNDTTFGTSTIAGNLRVITTGNVSQTAAIDVAGTVDITAVSRTVALSNSDNVLGQLNINAKDISVTEDDALDAGQINATGALTLTSTSAITDSARVTASGTTTLSGASIALDSSSNSFGKLSLTSAGAVTLFETTQVDLFAATIGGDFSLTTDSTVNDSGTLDVTGATTITAGSNSITLDNKTSVFDGKITLSGASITLVNAQATTLGKVTTARTSSAQGSLIVTSTGPITADEPLSVVAAAKFTATGQSIALTNGSNIFGALTLTGGDTTIVEAEATEIALAVVTGTLTITSDGSITDSGKLVVSGTTTVNAAAGTADVALDTTGNTFGSLAITANNVSIVEGAATDLAASKVNGTLSIKSGGAVTQSGELAVTNETTIATNFPITLTDADNVFARLLLTGTIVSIREADATDLGTSKTTTLTVNSEGDITDSGRLTIAGATTLTANSGTANIEFDELGHKLGSLLLTAKNVAIDSEAAVDLGDSNISEALTLTSKFAVTDSGKVIVGGVTTITSGTNTAITLNSNDSMFGKLVLSGASITIVEADATELGTTTSTGSFTVISKGAITDTGALSINGRLTAIATGDITLNDDNNFQSLVATGANIVLNEESSTDLAGISASGTFLLTSQGTVTDTGKITAAGTTITTPDAISLDFTTSTFGVLALSGSNLLVNNADVGGIALGATTATGTLTVTAKSISDSGVINATGLTTLNAGTGNLSLDLANSFGTLQLTGAAVVINEAGATDLGNSKITGTLGLTSTGPITQSAGLNVGGALTINAAGQAIALSSPSNVLGSTVAFTGTDVVIVDSTALELAASTATGSLTVTARGNLTDGGILNVGTTTSLTSTGGDVLIDLAHVLGGALSVSGKNVAITGLPEISLASLTATGTASLSTLGAVSLGVTRVTGTTTISAGGNVTENGLLSLVGNVTIAAGTNDVLLDTTAGHSFGTLIITGKNIAVKEAAGTDLGTLIATGNFTLTTTGNVTDSGVLTVTGATTLNAGTSAITLDKLSSYGTSLSLTGGTVVVASNAPLNLGTTTVSGGLTIVTTGAITDSGTISVAGTTLLAAGAANDITLNTETNAFATVKIVNAKNVTLADVGGINISDSTLAGSLAVNSKGDVTDSGKFTVPGTTSILAPGYNVTFDSIGSKFTGAITLSGENVTFVNGLATDFASITSNGNLSVTSTGAITDSGPVSVNGTTSLKATGVDITINELGTNLAGAVSLNGKNIVLSNHAATVLGSSSASGTFSITSNNNPISTATGSLFTLVGTSVLNAGTADISLALANSKLTSTLALTGDDITLTGNGAFKLAAVTAAGKLSIATNGNIEDIAKIDVGGTTNVDSGITGKVILDEATNEFDGTITLNGAALTFTNTKATTLDVVTSRGGFILSSGGAVTDLGTLTVGGTTTINAAGQNVLLDSEASSFGSLAVNGANVTIDIGKALDLGMSKITGNLIVTTLGSLTDSGKIEVFGTTTIDVDNFGSIVFDIATSTFAGAVSLDAVDISLKAAADLVFGTTTASGNMTIVVSGGNDITDVGVVTVLSNVSMNAGTGIIDLDAPIFRGTILMAAASVNYI